MTDPLLDLADPESNELFADVGVSWGPPSHHVTGSPLSPVTDRIPV
jgi:hypothetical protein